MSTRRRASLALALLALGLPAWTASARAEGDVSIRPSLVPDVLGAGTAFTFAFRVRASLPEDVPPPLSRIALHLPAGLTIDLHGVPTCAAWRLRRAGSAGCPAGSMIGRGQSTLAVHAGSQSIPEQAAVSEFRAPDRFGLPSFLILGRGQTPLQQQTISTATLSRDRPPYGFRLSVAIPPIPTLVLEPDASILSFSVTVGGVGPSARAHPGAARVLVPRRCPAGGFPFAADFAFADGTASRAAARVPCP